MDGLVEVPHMGYKGRVRRYLCLTITRRLVPLPVRPPSTERQVTIFPSVHTSYLIPTTTIRTEKILRAT